MRGLQSRSRLWWSLRWMARAENLLLCSISALPPLTCRPAYKELTSSVCCDPAYDHFRRRYHCCLPRSQVPSISVEPADDSRVIGGKLLVTRRLCHWVEEAFCAESNQVSCNALTKWPTLTATKDVVRKSKSVNYAGRPESPDRLASSESVDGGRLMDNALCSRHRPAPPSPSIAMAIFSGTARIHLQHGNGCERGHISISIVTDVDDCCR